MKQYIQKLVGKFNSVINALCRTLLIVSLVSGYDLSNLAASVH